MLRPAALSLALPVSAATFTVGPGGDCTHPTLQAALDSAAANSGADEVRIVRTATWTGIQISTNTNQDVAIVGGWAACSSQQPTGKTTLSGAGGQARSVIALRGNGNFTLRNLVIRDGDQAGDDDGGGIHFQGDVIDVRCQYQRVGAGHGWHGAAIVLPFRIVDEYLLYQAGMVPATGTHDCDKGVFFGCVFRNLSR